MNSRFILLLGVLLVSLSAQAEDNSTINLSSGNLAYLAELFSYKGHPQNLDKQRPVKVLINHGYMVGYSAARKMPVWAAYRVSRSYQDVSYDAPPFFNQDARLSQADRLSPDSYDGSRYVPAHMAPNLAVNHLYGKLAQLETFLMSNIAPQTKGLNDGVWGILEDLIFSQYADDRSRLWVVTGPAFIEEMPKSSLGIAIPSHYYVVVMDVGEAPFNKQQVMALLLPQTMTEDQELTSQHLVSVDRLEELTRLNFFPRLFAKEEKRIESEPAKHLW